MKILVAGKSGQVASSMVGLERPAHTEIIAAGRPELDLSQPETITTALDRYKPDIVVNAAAYTAVDKAEEEETEAFLINSEGAAHLAQASAAQSIPLIHISTDYVFDGGKTEPYVETDPVAPLGVYGRSKLEGERRVADACSRHITLRTAWVVSPYGNNFVKTTAILILSI